MIGKVCPSFKTKGYDPIQKKIFEFCLNDLKGKWVYLMFYPLNFTYVCPTELVSLSNKIQKFKDLNCLVYGISVDSVFSHLVWC